MTTSRMRSLLAPMLAACLVLGSLTAAGSRDSRQSHTTEDAGTEAALAATPAAVPVTLTATDAGLSMTATLDRSDVEPGGVVMISVVTHNGRAVPVTLGIVGDGGCPASMHATVPVPLGPFGRDWDGIAGEFKTFALTEGLAPGESPATAPTYIDAVATGCADPLSDTVTLAPGESTTTTLRWTASLVEGVAIGPGTMPIVISVLHDPSGAPPSYAPDYRGPLASWVMAYEELRVDGTMQVVGEATDVLSAGQAVDAMLADDRFAAWLADRPNSTWANANLFLDHRDAASGIAPAGTYWDIELFREHGVPRDWAIGYVDAFTGKVRHLTFCDDPCDR